MNIATLSLGLWLQASTVLTPWSQPACTAASNAPTPLGSFVDARMSLATGVTQLRHALTFGYRDVPAETQVQDALMRLRFHPRDYALDVALQRLSEEAIALMANQMLATEPKRAEAWARYSLSRNRQQASSAHVFVNAINSNIALLYGQTQNTLDSAGMALIRITCSGSCSAFVDGVPVAVREGYAEVDLLPGTHDVWVFDPSQPDRGNFEIVDLVEGQQQCVICTGIDQALPTAEQWWTANTFADSLDWAMACKRNAATFSASDLHDVIKGWNRNALVMSRSRWLRQHVVEGLVDTLDSWIIASEEENELDSPLARLTQDTQAPLPEQAEPILDILVGMSRVYQDISIANAAAELPKVGPRFQQRYRAPTGEGAIRIVCHERCWPTIMGVRVEADLHPLPPGDYFVEIHSTTGDQEPYQDWVEVTNGAVAEVPPFGSPPLPAPVPVPVDSGEPAFDKSQQFRRVTFGTAGAISLAGGAAWTVAIAAGMIPNHKVIDTATVLDTEAKLRLGLYMSGAFGLHAILATYFFVRMPKSQRPGMPLVAAGGGMLGAGAYFGGVGIAGAILTSYARASMDGATSMVQMDALRKREQSSINTLIAGASAAGALIVSGSIVLGVGRHRARRSGVTSLRRSRSRVSGLRLSPNLELDPRGLEQVGLRIAGEF